MSEPRLRVRAFFRTHVIEFDRRCMKCGAPRSPGDDWEGVAPDECWDPECDGRTEPHEERDDRQIKIDFGFRHPETRQTLATSAIFTDEAWEAIPGETPADRIRYLFLVNRDVRELLGYGDDGEHDPRPEEVVFEGLEVDPFGTKREHADLLLPPLKLGKLPDLEALKARGGDVFYGSVSCWWSDHLPGYKVPGTDLPSDPRGGPLFQALGELRQFVEKAEANAEHYGGIENFRRAFHGAVLRRSVQGDYLPTCFQRWQEYGEVKG